MDLLLYCSFSLSVVFSCISLFTVSLVNDESQISIKVPSLSVIVNYKAVFELMI